MTTKASSTTKKQRITLFMNPSIAKQARAQAIVQDFTLTEIVENALIDYLPDEIVIKKPVISKQKR